MNITFKSLLALILAAMSVTSLFASDYSSEVSMLGESGSDVTFRTVVVADKANKEAQALAVESTINAILNEGIDGLHNGQPMVENCRKDYVYRMFSTQRYMTFLSAQPQKLEELKFNGKRKIAYKIIINIASLKKDVSKNELAINHVWADPHKESSPASVAIRPDIVIIPEMNALGGDFERMRYLVTADPAYKAAVNKMTELFVENGYKTRDFRTALENSKTDDVLRDGADTDARTMIVQQLPGDIVVKVEVTTKQKGKLLGADIAVRAVEKQTETPLAAETFNSGYYHSSDPSMLVSAALDKIGPDFFSSLSAAFDDMAKNGRRMVLDFNISQAVSAEWDFDTESPADGSDFREELEEWIRTNSFGGQYKMDNSTSKYMKVEVNIPLWDAAKNRSYRITNFTSALKKFLRSKLGDEYKPEITAMGQKLSIIIE